MDFAFGSLGGIPFLPKSLDTGTDEHHIITVTARPSFVINRILSPLGVLAPVLIISLLTFAGGLLIVELIAIISSAQLTRTLTRTIHDLSNRRNKPFVAVELVAKINEILGEALRDQGTDHFDTRIGLPATVA